jgi:hypothetical protein
VSSCDLYLGLGVNSIPRSHLVNMPSNVIAGIQLFHQPPNP